MRARLTRLEGGLGVAIDDEAAAAAAFGEGDTVEVSASAGRLVISRVPPAYTLDDLLADTTPDSYRATAVDWGPDLGREKVE
jgi:antitoxin component of MazEF toxin-antitoxin module